MEMNTKTKQMMELMELVRINNAYLIKDGYELDPVNENTAEVIYVNEELHIVITKTKVGFYQFIMAGVVDMSLGDIVQTNIVGDVSENGFGANLEVIGKVENERLKHQVQKLQDYIDKHIAKII